MGKTTCKATNTTGHPCHKPPTVGSEYCLYHHNQNQHRENLTHLTPPTPPNRNLIRYGNAKTTGITPENALQEELERTFGNIRWIEEQITQSDMAAFTQSMWLFKRQDGYINPAEINTRDFKQSTAIWVDLYLKERNFGLKVAEAAAKTSFEERRVHLAETTITQIGSAIIGLITRLGLDPDNPKIREATRLALVEASGTIDTETA